jgi:hypothetical protein
MKKNKMKADKICEADQEVSGFLLRNISQIAAGLAARDQIHGASPEPHVIAREAIAIYCEIIDQLKEKATDA